MKIGALSARALTCAQQCLMYSVRLFHKVHKTPRDIVDAATRFRILICFSRQRPSFGGLFLRVRVVSAWAYNGTCAQLIPRLHNLLKGCSVSTTFYISWYADGIARDLYRLVRCLADAVQLKDECTFSLRNVEVNVAHVQHWRTMFPRLKV